MKIVIQLILSMTLFACGGSGSEQQSASTNPAFNPDYSNLKPYISAGPYASSLVACVAIESDSDSCTLNELPAIGMDNIAPSIDDIIDHLVVSHTWMGDRMAALLQLMPADMLLMLRSTTAIVIDDDIRPSHFKQATGAIYIDPAYLWLTNVEKATINPKEDFRSNYGKDLLFKRLWRYVINNQYAWQNYPLDGTEERTITDTLISTSWLFYHELAHANDCLPPDQINNLDPTSSYLNNYRSISNSGQCIHDRLVALYPLMSTVWPSLAGVLYHGNNSTESQRGITPEAAGADFEMDIANDTYSYSSIWEDTAMVFEAILMKRNFNADRDMAIVDYYTDFDCAAVVVKWGQRGRLGDLAIIARAEFVIGEILPELDLTGFYAEQPLPTQIPLDTSYCSLDYSAQKIALRQETTESMRLRLASQREIK